MCDFRAVGQCRIFVWLAVCDLRVFVVCVCVSFVLRLCCLDWSCRCVDLFFHVRGFVVCAQFPLMPFLDDCTFAC